ncbi:MULTISPECIES: class III extradiol dioxygenase subunit B-like domain-containing protein [unclassified Micromonospora]|uniref:class III extradiol dioxygenase subunit B-like domain-containing protein n=1 Tax=unclassified Micromonospora TaxID=2617518 RepID=UPI0036341922
MTGSARGRTGGSRYGERVPLVAAAVCPHPPLIVPELAGAAAAELDDLRRAADHAVARLLACAPDGLVLLGAGPATGWIAPPAVGSFRPWGADLSVPLPAGPDDTPLPPHAASAGGDVPVTVGGQALPLSLTVGAWLLARHRIRVPVAAAQVDAEATAAELASLAGQVHQHRPRVALLVLGDGSACHGTNAPGYADPRAGAYDDGVARALAGADAEALLGLDPALSARLKVAGRAPWQVLAGATRAAGGDWRGRLTYHGAPYGVAYFVATWERA